MSDFGNYDDQHRLPRQHSIDRANDYMSQQQQQPPLPPQSASSSSMYYQQNYGLSRSVTLPEPQHNSRRSNSYNIQLRQMHNDDEMQHDGMRNLFLFHIFYSSV